MIIANNRMSELDRLRALGLNGLCMCVHNNKRARYRRRRKKASEKG
jgi:hypothetical protein